jgi:hypothetical protein
MEKASNFSRLFRIREAMDEIKSLLFPSMILFYDLDSLPKVLLSKI